MGEPRLEMAPLLDVMFLLLTFFIFAFVLMVRLEVTDITLPTTAAGQSLQRSTAIILSIDAEGGVTLDGLPVALDDLKRSIRTRLEAVPGASLLVATDAGTRAEDLFDLVDSLKAAGFTELRFLRKPGGSTPTDGGS